MTSYKSQDSRGVSPAAGHVLTIAWARITITWARIIIAWARIIIALARIIIALARIIIALARIIIAWPHNDHCVPTHYIACPRISQKNHTNTNY